MDETLEHMVIEGELVGFGVRGGVALGGGLKLFEAVVVVHVLLLCKE